MRHRTATCLFAAIALLTLSSVAVASPRSELKGADSESALRRTRRDATWLREASLRRSVAPATLKAGTPNDLTLELDAWLRRDRAAEAAPTRTASNTPRP